VIWPAGTPGFDPIRNDPYKDVFLPSGEQCRPYVTIILTDGNESCGDDYVAATTSLFTTDVDGQDYTIRTRPIGMQAPGANGDPQIEDIAHAGGATDVVGQLEGFYAENEQQLQLAISSIVADALRFETCNGLDDDCDTFVDEDFTSLGAGCADTGIGVCQGTGVYECRADGAGTECVITTPGDLPGDEVCNGLDDDCDTHVDEGDVCVGCTGVELCNNADDDCDGLVDEDLTRPCGTDIGECQAGTETCEAGAWINCDAIDGTPEICDDFDNDCDGSINGIAEECSNLPGGNPGIGECHPGSQICDVSGDFGPCLGEVVPVDEICDTLDNDCDGIVDEDTGGVDCSTDCGLGQTVCVDGVLECNATPADDDDTCNGIDDDCDDSIDEDAPSGGACDEAGEICNGELICMTGTYVCVGDPIQDVDQCDCEDNDCDDMIDENNGLCPGGSTCSDCECRFPCQPGEFPCAVGQICDQETDLCVEDICFGVTCSPLPDGTATECQRATGECVSVCEGVTCNEGLICYGPTGECEPDNCSTFPERCGEGERCEEGACVADPCFGVTCEGAAYCFDGDCIASCAGVDCPSGERCRLGVCEADPCGGDCGSGRVCDDDTGTCVANPCDGESCDPGLVCDPQSGECIDDPCASITCPGAGQVCDFGTCRDPQQIDEDVITTGGGGGGCSTGGGSASGLALALLALLATRSPRRPSRRDQGGAS
jgi:Notch-like protein